MQSLRCKIHPGRPGVPAGIHCHHPRPALEKTPGQDVSRRRHGQPLRAAPAREAALAPRPAVKKTREPRPACRCRYAHPSKGRFPCRARPREKSCISARSPSTLPGVYGRMHLPVCRKPWKNSWSNPAFEHLRSPVNAKYSRYLPMKTGLFLCAAQGAARPVLPRVPQPVR